MGLLGLFIQSVFVQNILLFNFLGMCSYLACSNKITTAHGLGLAVTVVLTISGILNWFIHHFVTGAGALSWAGMGAFNLSFLELIIYISVIAGFVQVLEIVIDKFSPVLYAALGVYLPLITVNCAILGGCLFATAREYAFLPNLVYVFGSGLGWWLAIALLASIREKLSYSNIPKGLRGMGIAFIMTGLIAMTFMALTGITLDTSKKKQGPISGFPQNP
ncbi:MAG: NADH:ubiquinone reductase (Na(+)-transporting) subunit E [Chlamydiae bacterium RIFCSPHIGHO2_12_FULL_49_9]|nr:MAG: NADH:ubiquinone reductase (Na(+)-transporting) subunit E [Chlamydiae bacterium RIFCSPHIGHO2_12_FULL_49_9]